ncbi:hypothetical protein J2S17_005962 [Cytobacillus purgationiresistens]|uniref:Uncharacterized protein n=1 Tax=Cytobacillus purgationiresistens TaxID=863449 RepID=A0ABU0ARV5_9BACI|nr:hypothetical protein [Cytobacillus purgationiresistens]
MFTYDTFEVSGSFTLMRPVFISCLIISIILLISIMVAHFRQRKMSCLTVIGISVMTMLISSQLIFYQGIIVDEIGSGGDSLSFIIYVATVCLSFANPLIFLYLFKEKQMTN